MRKKVSGFVRGRHFLFMKTILSWTMGLALMAVLHCATSSDSDSTTGSSTSATTTTTTSTAATTSATISTTTATLDGTSGSVSN